MPDDCKYPGCQLPQHGSFALVPLCKAHFRAVWKETRHYYKTGRQQQYRRARPAYLEIAYRIPWSRPVKEEGAAPYEADDEG